MTNRLRQGSYASMSSRSTRARARNLYQPRIKIFPKRTWGTFRKLKWWIMAVTLGIYWVTPWLRWDRGPNAPDQAVLIDLANRRFYFFFIEIWPQEFYYVAGLLIMAGLGLFLFTSVAGRVWCGYTCPQTVWTDLFIWVERFIEGDRNARMRLDKAPWGFEKIAKRAVGLSRLAGHRGLQPAAPGSSISPTRRRSSTIFSRCRRHPSPTSPSVF